MTPEALKLRADNNLAQLPPKERERVSWILSAGADDMQRQLKSMTGTAADRRVLEVAYDLEQAGAKRSTRLKPVSAAMKRFTVAIDGKAQVVAGVDLSSVVSALETLEEGIKQIDRRAQLEQLPLKLKQGFHAFRAHLHFAIKDHKVRGGRKSSSRREELSFGEWLAEAAPWLKEGTAYKYMTAFRGLGLPDDATEEAVDAALAALVAPSLAGLIAAATERIGPPPEKPAVAVQLTLDDYLATLKAFREDADTVIEQAKDMPENLRKAACARAYATLAALTGTPWQPADEHDQLGSLDPDNIAL